ncbi:DUF5050 domain-containing protein [Haloimpatiens sp. FM7315]|uniref:DUF5050 domain-containing protein n=1 Tax=Haloimpatiens sp. FM7315 TaxID=3298609 RepID=UPI0035A2D197
MKKNLQYINENAEYNYDNNAKIDEINAYSIIVNGKGICMGYASAMHYLLDKVGVECQTVVSDEPFHMWLIVKIDGKYYHVDPTFEDTVGFGRELTYFNITDKERNKNGSFKKLWYGGNKNYKKLKSPVCSDDKYKFLRDCSQFYLRNKIIYYVNSNDNKLYKVIINGKGSEKILDTTVNEMAMYKDWIYYTNTEDKNRIYKVKAHGTGNIKVDDKAMAFNLRIVDNYLVYKVDSGEDASNNKDEKIKLN